MTSVPCLQSSTEAVRPGRVLVVEHEANAGPGLVGRRIVRAGIELVTVGPETRTTTIPTEASAYDGVIVLGGTPGPADDEAAPWLPNVRALIRWCLNTGTPYLGVCLGGQMLAYVGGGTVGPVRRGPEVGVHSVAAAAIASADPVFAGLAETTRAIQWHWLEVHSPPPGAQVLASSSKCPIQAFRLGQTAWGTQFHLEANSDTVRGWASGDREDLRSLGLDPQELIAGAIDVDACLDATWSPIIDSWIEVMAESRSSRVLSADAV